MHTNSYSSRLGSLPACFCVRELPLHCDLRVFHPEVSLQAPEVCDFMCSLERFDVLHYRICKFQLIIRDFLHPGLLCIPERTSWTTPIKKLCFRITTLWIMKTHNSPTVMSMYFVSPGYIVFAMLLQCLLKILDF